MWAGRLENCCVNHNAKHDPHCHGIEDDMTHIFQQDKEASKEEEDRRCNRVDTASAAQKESKLPARVKRIDGSVLACEGCPVVV